jgi:hypothetical protein
MSKPTILTVDDDPQVSAAITRDLKHRHDQRVHRDCRLDPGHVVPTSLATVAIATFMTELSRSITN